MKNLKKALTYGAIVWLLPFLFALLVFPIHESNRILFETLMPIVIVGAVVAFALSYFKLVDSDFVKEGLRLGFLWMGISIFIDLIMILPGSPMEMRFLSYLQDIGLIYFVIPIITFGLGKVLESRLGA